MGFATLERCKNLQILKNIRVGWYIAKRNCCRENIHILNLLKILTELDYLGAFYDLQI